MTRRPRDFLPDVNMRHLTESYKKESDPKAKIRLRAYILKKKKVPVPDIIEEIGVPHATLYAWFRTASREGLVAVYDKKRPGRTCALSNDALEKLTKVLNSKPQDYGFEKRAWTGPIIKKYIEKEFGTDYNIRTVQLLFHRLGFKFSSRKKAPEPKKIKKTKRKYRT